MPSPVRLPSRFVLGIVLGLVCVRAAAAQQASTVVIVVRHADKDTIPRADPPLTAAGVARAKALAAALADAGVQAVITTELLRSRETARPLAEARGLTTTTVPHGSDIAQHAQAVAAAVRKLRGKTVLVVGHGETVGPIIQALGGPPIPEVCAYEYSNLYTLVLDENDKAVRLIHSSYGAPTPAHASPCTMP
ncbi:MAG TPA: histidine phosphatase family protein [Gemmatimonadaceae bacterium]